MVTIVEEKTGLVIYCAETFDLNEGEAVVNELPSIEYDQETEKLYWDFANKKFYSK